jgi:hypothetical protein
MPRVASRATRLRGLAPRTVLGLGLLGAGAAAACGETRGRILWGPLGAAPTPAPTSISGGDASGGDAAVEDVSTPDAAPAMYPRPLAVTPTSSTQPNGGNGARRSTTEPCPPGYAVIGYQGGLTALPEAGDDGGLGVWLGRIQTLCGAVMLADASATHVTVVDDGTTLPVVGETQDSAWVRKCDFDEVVVGLQGRFGSFVDELIVVCAHWSVSPPNTLSVDALRPLAPVGGPGGSRPFGGGMCAAGQMAIGTTATWGFYVDSLALVCGVPSERP